MAERLRLALIVLASVVLMVVVFPLGYSAKHFSASGAALFSVADNYSNLSTSENINLASVNASTNGPWLELAGNGVPDPTSWAIFTVTASTVFPNIAGVQLSFSGNFAGLNLTSSTIRVSILLTKLSSVVKLYYLIGAQTIPSNTGSFRFYGVSIPMNGTSFSAQRDIAQDMNTAGAQVDSSWEVQSISLGFITYPPVSSTSRSFLVRFNQSYTTLAFSGNRIDTSFTDSFTMGYYAIPVLLLSSVIICILSEDVRKAGSFLARSFKRQARVKS